MKKRIFARTLFIKQIKFNVIAAILIALLIGLFLNIRLQDIKYSMLALAPVVFVLQAILAPLTHTLLTRKLQNNIEEWKSTGFYTDHSKTLLMEKVMRYPLKKGLETFLIFTFGCTFYPFLLHFMTPLTLEPIEFSYALASSYFGSYLAGILAMYYSEKQCIALAEELFITGVDKEYVMSKKFFGIKPRARYILFLIVPIVYANVLMFMLLSQIYTPTPRYEIAPLSHVIRMLCLTAIVVFICIFIGIMYYRQLMSSNNKLADTLTQLISNNEKNKTYASSLNDPLQYNIFLLNNIVSKYNTLISKADVISRNIQTTTENLSIISSEVSGTSINQNSDVNEIVQTVNQTDELSMNIENNIQEVSQRISQTNSDVENSFTNLDSSIQQMSRIQETNRQIIDGIKNLTKQIDSIDDIISMIREVSDQTKIIAMNAELEAVAAKEEGKSFHIIANEIQLLQTSSFNSVKEIQSYLEVVKNASVSLIQASERGTHLIQEQSVITEELKSHFAGIKESSQITNQKTDEIKQIVREQTSSFSQIVTTLSEISNGFKNFIDSTKEISSQAERLSQAAAVLSKI